MVGQHVFEVGLDLRAVGHALRVLGHEDGLFVEQLHVHVDVVDAVVGKVLHPHVGVKAHEVGKDALNLLHTLVGVLGAPPRVAAAVLIHDEVGGESGAESVAHEVAPGVHQVVGLGRGFVQVDAHLVRDDLGRGVVLGAGAVVDPVHDDAVVHPVAVHRVRTVVPDPHRVHGVVDDGDVVQTGCGTAVVAGGEVILDVVGVAGQDDDLAFLRRVDHNLLLDGAVAFPSDAEDLDFFPFGHGAQVVERRRGSFPAGHRGVKAVCFVILDLAGVRTVGQGVIEALGPSEDRDEQAKQQQEGRGRFHGLRFRMSR